MSDEQEETWWGALIKLVSVVALIYLAVTLFNRAVRSICDNTARIEALEDAQEKPAARDTDK